MPISVKYGVPIQTAGQIAFAGGKGIFAQERDRYQLQQDALTQKESQFTRDLEYQKDLALLKDRQFQDQQEAANYRFERGIQATQYDRYQGRLADMQRMGMGEQFRIAGEGRADTRMQAQEVRRDKRLISQEGRQRETREEEQKYLLANKSAEKITEWAKNVSPEQAEQVVKQWEQQYGRDFPFQSEYDSQRTRMDYGTASAQIREQLGGDATDGDVSGFIRQDENGNAVPLYDDPIMQAEAIRQERENIFQREYKQNTLNFNAGKQNWLEEQNVAERDLKEMVERNSRLESALDEQRKEEVKRYDDRQKVRKSLIGKKDADGEWMSDPQKEAWMAEYDKIVGQDSLPGQAGPGSSMNNPIIVNSLEHAKSLKLSKGTWVKGPGGTGQVK